MKIDFHHLLSPKEMLLALYILNHVHLSEKSELPPEVRSLMEVHRLMFEKLLKEL